MVCVCVCGCVHMHVCVCGGHGGGGGGGGRSGVGGLISAFGNAWFGYKKLSSLMIYSIQSLDTWTPIPVYHPWYRGINKIFIFHTDRFRVWELCESQGGRPGLPVLMSLTVSVDVKQHWTMLRHCSQFVPNMSTDIRGHEALHHRHHHHTESFIWLSDWNSLPNTNTTAPCFNCFKSHPEAHWRTLPSVFQCLLEDSAIYFSVPSHTCGSETDLEWQILSLAGAATGLQWRTVSGAKYMGTRKRVPGALQQGFTGGQTVHS